MKYEVKVTTKFKKDLKLAKKQGRNTDKLLKIIEQLANGEPLEAKYRDHDLTGEYLGCRECHIEPDWLLIYEIFDDVLVLLLNRVGSHSELFR
jgi:mRNA interferase YafQ